MEVPVMLSPANLFTPTLQNQNHQKMGELGLSKKQSPPNPENKTTQLEVQLLSNKLVKPSTPTPEHLRNYKISFIDQSLFPIYTHEILYYRVNGNDATAAERRDVFVQALSEILTVYYPLAGRYVPENLSVDCNDSGAEVVVAKASCKLSQVLSGEFDVQELNQLVPTSFESARSPLLLAQFNVFECGGIAIGIAFSHRLVDGVSIAAIVNGWAALTREAGKGTVHSPCLELSSAFPARQIPHAISEQPEPEPQRPEAKPVTKRFVFRGEAIRSLKAIANFHGGVSERQFSKVEVVTALLWRSLIATSQALHGELRHYFASILVNMRQKINIPMSDSSFGNFIDLAYADFEPEGHEGKVKIQELASKLHCAIRTKVKEYSEISNSDDLFLPLRNNFKKLENLYYKNNGEEEVYIFSSWCRFPVQEADFGWGKPVWASLAHMPLNNSVFILDSMDGEGVEAWVTMDVRKMSVFQKNADIRAFTSEEYYV